MRLHQPTDRCLVHAEMVGYCRYRILTRQIRKRDRVVARMLLGEVDERSLQRTALYTGYLVHTGLLLDQALHCQDEGL